VHPKLAEGGPEVGQVAPQVKGFEEPYTAANLETVHCSHLARIGVVEQN
jgi:hypothetical protein